MTVLIENFDEIDGGQGSFLCQGDSRRHHANFLKGLCVTIGNYDGIHRGHVTVLERLKAVASNAFGSRLDTAVVTFCPHPKDVLCGIAISHDSAIELKDNPYKKYACVSCHEKNGDEVEEMQYQKHQVRLMNFDEKFSEFAEMGIDYVFCMRFDENFAGMDPHFFASDILVRRLNTKAVVVGSDFRFGKGTEGSVEILRQLGLFLEIVPLLDINGEKISSRNIIGYLRNGNLPAATEMLGRYYYVVGKIIHGDQLASQVLNFPTANIKFDKHTVPLHGVYLVRVEFYVNTGLIKRYGVANVGFRPTNSQQQDAKLMEKTLEVHILNLEEEFSDLYSGIMQVEFILKIRDEIKFAGFTELREQITIDILKAKELIEENRRIWV